MANYRFGEAIRGEEVLSPGQAALEQELDRAVIRPEGRAENALLLRGWDVDSFQMNQWVDRLVQDFQGNVPGGFLDFFVTLGESPREAEYYRAFSTWVSVVEESEERDQLRDMFSELYQDGGEVRLREFEAEYIANIRAAGQRQRTETAVRRGAFESLSQEGRSLAEEIAIWIADEWQPGERHPRYGELVEEIGPEDASNALLFLV